MRRDGKWKALVGLAMVVIAGAGCPQGPGGNDNGNGDSVDGPNAPGEPVAGFFEADESWAISSPEFVVIGVGNYIEAMVISNEAGDDRCVIPEPDAVVDFENDELSIETDRETDGVGVSCAIDATLGTENCAPQEGEETLTPCSLAADADGLEFEGETLGTGDPTLVRFDECTSPVPPLSQIESWNLVSLHPINILFSSDPRALGGGLIGGGSGDELGAFLVTTSVADGVAEGCFVSAPNGTVTLEDGELEVDITLEDDENNSTCTVEFSGTLTYCTMFDPSALGGSGEVVPLLRFDGTGRIDTGDNDESLPTLYFGYIPDEE